jgi:ATP-dependent Clp protease ATP-binding subunit ClpA
MELMTGGMGFVQPKDKLEEQLNVKVERTAQEAAKKKFSPEFMNRLDKVVVFHPLREEQLEKILDIELEMVQKRVMDSGRGQFLFRTTSEAKRFLLQEGTDIKYGARHLKRAIEKHVVHPLANLLSTDQIRFGDMIVADWDDAEQCIAFHREGQGAFMPANTRRQSRTAAARASSCTLEEEKIRVAAMGLETVLTR